MIPVTTLTKNPSWKSSPGFALISVLALVSLAALTATAFLASARLERQASSSIGKTTLLEMALNSGKFCVTQLINDYSQTDLGNTAIVTYWRTNWTDELGYPFIAKTKTSGGNNGQNSAMWYYAPLFSPAGVTNLGTNDIQNAMRFTNIHQGTFSNDMQTFMTQNATNGFTNNPGLTNSKCVQIPLLGGRTSPPVGWVYIDQEKRKFGSTLTNTSPVVRIAWFTEDLEGLIDADRMGATTNRSTGTNSEEVSLSSATGTNGTALVSSVSTFTNNRTTYISYGLLATNGGLANPTNARYFASGLQAWAPTPASLNNGALAWIPVGIPVSGTSTAPKGYGNQGYTKLNINTLVTSSGSDPVGTIAAAITNNLPSFRARSGAMNSNAYISNIAANIVDYVDTDTNPTIDSSAGIPNWRGVEAIAWPNEVFTRFNLTDRQTNPPNYLFKLGIKHYIELWNLSSTSVVVNGSDYSISNNLDIPLKCTNWPGNLKSADSANPPASETCTNANFTLPPNSYGVIATGTRTFNILVPTNLATNANPSLTINPSTTANKYTISYKGNIIDATPAGRWLDKATNMKVGDFHFITTSVNFGTSGNGSTYNLSAGDPRGGLFVNQPAMDFPYNQTTPGGRNSHLSSSGGARIVDPKVNWVDSGHSSTADIVTSPTDANANNSIPQGPQKVGNPNHWIQKANNSGKLTNIMELGNIFDPIQWGDPNNPFHPLDTAAWMGLSNSATSFNGACGRTTLRLGRAEHQRFAFTNMYGNSVPPIPNMGMSSAALLDIFCLTNGSSVGGSTYTLGGGKINLNTAPAPVLRALAGGIRQSNDLAQVPGNYAIPPAMAEAFAQGVMRFRSKYPFLTPSHLSFIGTDPTWPNTNNWPTNAVFGNTNSITLSTAPGNTFGSTARMNMTEWNDEAAEEWFSKIYALSSCQSHNYRIYVVAQLVATNSAGQINPMSPLVKKYYQVFFQNGSAVSAPTKWPPTTSTYPNNDVSTWTPTGYATDIFKSYY
jgi:hypothetical protein